MCLYVYMLHIYIYIYIEREREKNIYIYIYIYIYVFALGKRGAPQRSSGFRRFFCDWETASAALGWGNVI